VTADRLQNLAARRRALASQSDALRERLLEQGAKAHRSLRITRLAGSVARSLARSPLALVAGVAVLMAVGPHRTMRAVTGVVSAWFLLRRASGVATALWRVMRRQ
jgi:hypothetical protein